MKSLDFASCFICRPNEGTLIQCSHLLTRFSEKVSAVLTVSLMDSNISLDVFKKFTQFFRLFHGYYRKSTKYFFLCSQTQLVLKRFWRYQYFKTSSRGLVSKQTRTRHSHFLKESKCHCPRICASVKNLLQTRENRNTFAYFGSVRNQLFVDL